MRDESAIASIFLTLFLLNNSQQIEADSNQFYTFVHDVRINVTIENGKRLQYPEQTVISRLIGESFRECIRKCYDRRRCKALEYRQTMKLCILFDEYSSDDVQTQPGRLIVYDFPDQDDRKCGSKTCTRMEACIFSNNEYTCTIEECRIPPESTPRFGNVHHIGSKIKMEWCDSTTNFECSENGQWWVDGETQSGLTCEDMTGDSRFFTNRLGHTMLCNTLESWTVFQRRINGDVDFYRDWEDYKYGFGSPCGNYWMGLKHLNGIMRESDQQFELIIELVDWAGVKVFAHYNRFFISDEADKYRLTIDGYDPRSTANGDMMAIHNGNSFSTFDRDNDINPDMSCAIKYRGAWWFSRCFNAHLHGNYLYSSESSEFGEGLIWFSWHGYNYSLKHSLMKMRVYMHV